MEIIPNVRLHFNKNPSYLILSKRVFRCSYNFLIIWLTIQNIR
nr:MAG TPA: hypothetical protein [Caudoviricetes sp.]